MRRQWAPRLAGRGLRARFDRARRGDGDRSGWLDVLGLPDWAGEAPAAILGVAVFIAVVVLMLFLGLPLILALVDVVLVVVLVLGGVVARVLFRRPWTVEAVDGASARVTRRVVGWGASGRTRDEMAAELAHGRIPGPDPSGATARRRRPREGGTRS